MRAKHFFINTLKEAPSDAQIVSHQLMLRSGMIKKVAAGIYTYSHLGLKVLRKIEQIVREEMNNSNALECLMPVVQPAELWQETNRLAQFGDELLKFKDRHGHDFVIQPTSEEVVTALVRSDIKSYKQLPVCLYQIQTKFRDERRPRFGVMRGREFVMKDAYSFDADAAGMQTSYQTMFATYERIFNRLGLSYKAVDADTGAIGGVGSCEFHVLAQTGEDTLVYSTHPESKYAANLETAHNLLPSDAELDHQLASNINSINELPMQLIATPTQKTCEAVAEMLSSDLTTTIKSIVMMMDVPDQDIKNSITSITNANNIQNAIAQPLQMYLILLRGDDALNETKLNKALRPKLPENAVLRFATDAEIQQAFNCVPGFLGPVNLPKQTDIQVHVIADLAAANMRQFTCGANQVGMHLQYVNWARDCHYTARYDLRNAKIGDISPDQLGTLDFCRGIEVGHVFMLGTKYSEAMHATFLDNTGKPKPLVMGCYGIGVSRIMGAAIEQNFDEKGIIWSKALSPFEVIICPINYDKSAAVKQQADALYETLKSQGLDVILDDRCERVGAMLADWELIGIPKRIVIGDKNLEQNMFECQNRRLSIDVTSEPVKDQTTDKVTNKMMDKSYIAVNDLQALIDWLNA